MSNSQLSSQDMDRQFFLKMAQKSQDLRSQIEQTSSCIQEIVEAANSKKHFENEKKQLKDIRENGASGMKQSNTSQNFKESMGNFSTEQSSGELKDTKETSILDVELKMDID